MNREIYGFKIDKTLSSPSEAVTYIKECDNKNFTPVSYKNHKLVLNEWANVFFIKEMSVEKNKTTRLRPIPSSYLKFPTMYIRIIENNHTIGYISNEEIPDDFIQNLDNKIHDCNITLDHINLASNYFEYSLMEDYAAIVVLLILLEKSLCSDSINVRFFIISLIDTLFGGNENG